MLKKKSQELVKTTTLTFNYVCLIGVLTQKGELLKTKLSNFAIKFVLSNTIYCIAGKKYAEMINVLKQGTKLLVEGKIMKIKEGVNVVVCETIEYYTPQGKIDTKKQRKELKTEKSRFDL